MDIPFGLKRLMDFPIITETADEEKQRKLANDFKLHRGEEEFPLHPSPFNVIFGESIDDKMNVCHSTETENNDVFKTH